MSNFFLNGMNRCLASEKFQGMPGQTRRCLGGRHPLCGTGVTSLMTLISKPTAWIARTADSRPAPGPLTRTSTSFRPWPIACRHASWATICAAYAVLLRAPLKPHFPPLAQPIDDPFISVIVTIVLLKDATTCAIPVCTFLLPFALIILMG